MVVVWTICSNLPNSLDSTFATHDLFHLEGLDQQKLGTTTTWKLSSKPHTNLTLKYIAIPSLPLRQSLTFLHDCGISTPSGLAVVQGGNLPSPNQGQLGQGRLNADSTCKAHLPWKNISHKNISQKSNPTSSICR